MYLHPKAAAQKLWWVVETPRLTQINNSIMRPPVCRSLRHWQQLASRYAEVRMAELAGSAADTADLLVTSCARTATCSHYKICTNLSRFICVMYYPLHVMLPCCHHAQLDLNAAVLQQ